MQMRGMLQFSIVQLPVLGATEMKCASRQKAADSSQCCCAASSHELPGCAILQIAVRAKTFSSQLPRLVAAAILPQHLSAVA
jgi:hypothetical protein